MANKLFNLNPTTFFKQWKDDKGQTFALLLVAFFLGLGLTAIITNFPELTNTAIVYVILLLVTGFTGLFNLLTGSIFSEGKFGNVFAGLGAKPIIGFVLGVILGLLTTITGFGAISVPFSVLSTDIFIIVFVLLSAPLVEELFFRGLLQHMLVSVFNRWFKFNFLLAGISATLLQSSVFAVFHWRVFGGDITALGASFMFALVITIGNQLFRTLGFGLGLHFTNNLVVSIQQGLIF